MLSPELCKKYCIEEIEINKPSNLVGYRVLGSFDTSKNESENTTLGMLLEFYSRPEKIFIKTKEDRYLAEFTMCFTGSKEILVLADSECPEYYFIDQEDLSDMIKDVIKCIKENLCSFATSTLTTNGGNDYWTTVLNEPSIVYNPSYTYSYSGTGSCTYTYSIDTGYPSSTSSSIIFSYPTTNSTSTITSSSMETASITTTC